MKIKVGEAQTRSVRIGSKQIANHSHQFKSIIRRLVRQASFFLAKGTKVIKLFSHGCQGRYADCYPSFGSCNGAVLPDVRGRSSSRPSLRRRSFQPDGQDRKSKPRRRSFARVLELKKSGFSLFNKAMQI
jgi:hypothetical protein